MTLACGSETDGIGPDILERMARRLAGSEVEVFPGLGHFGPLEDPDAVARSVGSSFGTRRRHTQGVASAAWPFPFPDRSPRRR